MYSLPITLLYRPKRARSGGISEPIATPVPPSAEAFTDTMNCSGPAALDRGLSGPVVEPPPTASCVALTRSPREASRLSQTH